jgi:hypothetical protein
MTTLPTKSVTLLASITCRYVSVGDGTREQVSVGGSRRQEGKREAVR